MPIPAYGVWKASPVSFSVERVRHDPDTPHGYLIFEDGVSTLPELQAAINAKSKSSDSRLVYWIIEDFKHPILDRVKPLPKGWKSIGPNTGNDPNRLSLDYLRDGLVDLKEGTVVPHDIDGEKNDIADFMEAFFAKAIQDKEKGIVYIWGSQYREKTGLHNVHMNQGSVGDFADQNGPNLDGGVIVEYKDHWEAFFIAFASQAVKTQPDGQPDSKSESLAVFLGAPAPTGDSTGTGPVKPPTEPRPVGGDIVITAALVNPVGDDNVDNPEKVYLQNKTCSDISLENWTIENHLNHKYKFDASKKSTANAEPESFEATGVALSNKGGTIVLKNPEGKVVDRVTYTKEQASKVGDVIAFP